MDLNAYTGLRREIYWHISSTKNVFHQPPFDAGPKNVASKAFLEVVRVTYILSPPERLESPAAAHKCPKISRNLQQVGKKCVGSRQVTVYIYYIFSINSQIMGRCH